MERKEKAWRITEIVIGAVGAVLLIVILVLRLLKHPVLYLTYPFVGIVILFLIADECARSLKRKRLQNEAKKAPSAEPSPEGSGETLPKEAFEFEDKQS